jgi:predicted transcriptional regulator
MKKTTVINTLNELPKEFDLDDFLERLVVIDKIEQGLKDVKEGKTVSHEQVKKMISKWGK